MGYIVHFVFTPYLILAFLTGVIIIRDFALAKINNFRLRAADILILLYFLWINLSSAIASPRSEISVLYSLSSVSGLILYFFIRVYHPYYKKLLLFIVWAFAALVLVESLISFTQFAAKSPIFKNIEVMVDIEMFGRAPDEMEFVFRPVGTFSHANILGMWLSFWLSVILAVLYRLKSKLLFAVFAVGAVSLALTLSRSAWIGMTISILLILFVLEKMKKVKTPEIISKYLTFTIVVGIAVFIFIALPRLEKSLYSFGEDAGGGYLRNEQIKESLVLISQKPFWGTGMGMSVVEAMPLNPAGIFANVPLSVHNWFVLTAVESGVPALSFFLIFLLLILRRISQKIKNYRMLTLNQILPLGIMGGIISLVIVGFFHPFVGTGLILLSAGLINAKKN